MKTCLLNGEVIKGRGLSEDVSQNSSVVVPQLVYSVARVMCPIGAVGVTRSPVVETAPER